MTNTVQIFSLAQLAEASYAEFNLFSNNKAGLVAALEASGFSATQASEFAKNWRVVHHQPDTASDYSGTLFEYIGNDPASGFTKGKLVFAQRGTAGILGDILDADIHGIAVNGLAFKQIVDMYNYWQRLTANAGATVHEARLVSASLITPGDKLIIEVSPILGFPNQLTNNYYTIEYVDVTNAGIGVPNIGNLTDITGHSLGGHLADAFTRLFGGAAAATTINGAGYATGLLPGLGLAAGSNITNLFSMLGGAASFSASSATNIFGDKKA